ncbi:MAG TPA: hypothetical protein VHM19_14050 [Polyangiales bacterium]|nr:hypothetical protein [Polyangiales bacterium]
MQLSPNTLQFLGGLASVLVGALVLKQDGNGALVMGGVAAMFNALKSPHDVVKAKQEAKRASVAPPQG